MHMIDGGGRLSRVNRRWTEALGYSSEQVIGRFAPDFLTAESRHRAINETLPLYWRVGSVRSVRYRFVKKDGGVTDLQLDAELVAVAGANRLSYAAIRNIDDRTQWEQSSDTLATLVGLTKLQRKYQEVVFPAVSIQLQKPARLPDASTRYSPRPTPAGDVLLALLEIAGDISGSLKASETSMTWRMPLRHKSTPTNEWASCPRILHQTRYIRTLELKEMAIATEAKLTCPECGHERDEKMPTDACQFFYECVSCGSLLKPKAGDCCVFCSYADVRCPSEQARSL